MSTRPKQETARSNQKKYGDNSLMSYDSERLLTAKRNKSKNVIKPYQDQISMISKNNRSFKSVERSVSKGRKVDLSHITSLYRDAEKRQERRRNLVEQFVEKAEKDDFKVNCTFTPSINMNSRAMMNKDLAEDEEGDLLNQTLNQTLALSTKLRRSQIDQFFARKMKEKSDQEEKVKEQRELQMQKEKESLTFTPQMVSREIHGVKSVVDSFNRRLNVRPKAEVVFGNGKYARCGSREFNKSGLSPEALKRSEKLKEKNDLAVLDYIERVKKAQEMKDYKEEIMDFLGSRHRNAEQYLTQRGAQTARDGRSELYQTLTERRMRPISTSRPRDSSNAKSLNQTLTNNVKLSKQKISVN